MSVLFRHIARYIARRVASDPRTREKMARATRGVVEEARRIAGKKDRAHAAGQAVRRALRKFSRDAPN